MKKKILSLLLVIGMISTLSTSIYAKNMPVKVGNENKSVNNVFNLQKASSKIHLGTGHIKGDGVRFRKGPSTSSTILGLFTNGETVDVYYHSDCPSEWFYVYRRKTKQYGFVHSNYYVHHYK